jgi:SARP family transcriptional regulator, regulator of embCAB operon
MFTLGLSSFPRSFAEPSSSRPRVSLTCRTPASDNRGPAGGQPLPHVAASVAEATSGVYGRGVGRVGSSALASAGVVPGSQARLSLLGRFVFATGPAPVTLAPGSQRLLAFVALAGRAVRRDLAAGVLWPQVSEHQAHTSLRAALRRLGARAPGVMRADGCNVALVAEVGVDLHDRQVVARQFVQDSDAIAADVAAAAVEWLSAELLPGWYEDWVLLEAENWRQLRLHALEAAAGVLARAARYGQALAAAQAAVDADPLRESPHCALIAVHLREGNQSEALRAFDRYRRRLDAALGLEPTERLRALLPT